MGTMVIQDTDTMATVGVDTMAMDVLMDMDIDTMAARNVMLKLKLNPKLTSPTPMDILMPITMLHIQLLMPLLSIIMVWAMLTIILMPMVILLSTSNPQKRKKRLRKPEKSVKPKAMPRLIPKLGITDTMDILMDTDTTDMANR